MERAGAASEQCLEIPPFRGRKSGEASGATAASSLPRPSSHGARVLASMSDGLWTEIDGKPLQRSGSSHEMQSPDDSERLPPGLDAIDEGGPADVRAEHRMVCLVIPSHFLVDAHRECQQGEAELAKGRSGPVLSSPVKGIARTSSGGVAWRRLLVSPLVSFLTAGRKSEEWIQLSGHKGDFLPGTAGTILKKASVAEKQAYELLMEEAEPMRQFVPLFYKEVDINGEPFIEMEDLLGHFENPCCMDIKMGVRTFLESEVAKTKLRKDLLEKMMKLDPNEPTEEERLNGITKLRYMTYREKMSTSRQLGFRVEGIRLAGEPPQNDFKLISSRSEAEDVVRSFLPTHDSPVRRDIVAGLVGVLKELRVALESSNFFAMHELIGSSLLILYDHTGTKGVWMIDFGKTSKVELPLTHSEPWVLGNHEDGYLRGLDSIIDIMTTLS